MRSKAVSALGHFTPDATFAPLAQTVRADPDPNVRARAVDVLGWSFRPAVVDILLEALRDPAPIVHSQAARNLICYSELRVVDSLLALLAAQPQNRHVISTMGALHDPRAVEPLIARLRTYPQKKHIKGQIIGVYLSMEQ